MRRILLLLFFIIISKIGFSQVGDKFFNFYGQFNQFGDGSIFSFNLETVINPIPIFNPYIRAGYGLGTDIAIFGSDNSIIHLITYQAGSLIKVKRFYLELGYGGYYGEKEYLVYNTYLYSGARLFLNEIIDTKKLSIYIRAYAVWNQKLIKGYSILNFPLGASIGIKI